MSTSTTKNGTEIYIKAELLAFLGGAPGGVTARRPYGRSLNHSLREVP